MILRTFSRNLLKLNRQIGLSKPLDYAVCIDIECTCDTPLQIYPMEVIEIACIKLNLKPKTNDLTNDLAHCPLFHSYVRPVINPKLTLFCQDLTGILQPIVDRADTIEKVVENMMNWLKEQNLVDGNYAKKEEFAFASCGNFDLNLLSPIIKDCQFNNNQELPIYFREWINVKKMFVNHKREWPKGLYHMLELLDEKPSGRLHSAKDDCINLARVIECLHFKGCNFHVTNKVSQ